MMTDDELHNGAERGPIAYSEGCNCCRVGPVDREGTSLQ